MAAITEKFFDRDLLSIMVADAVGLILHSIVLRIFWAWFILPVFPVPDLDWLKAIGITLVVQVVTNDCESAAANSEALGGYMVGYRRYKATVSPLCILLIGYFIHLIQ